MAESKVPMCKICDAIQPVIFCNDCRQSICESCRGQHDQIHGFDKHSTLPLCKKHTEPVTHLCHKCIASMCIKCMIKTHKEHGEQFSTFHEGMQKMKKEAEGDGEEILKQKAKVDNNLERIKSDQKKNEELKDRLTRARAVYVDKISKIDNVLNDIGEKCEKHGADLVQKFSEPKDSFPELLAEIDFSYKVINVSFDNPYLAVLLKHADINEVCNTLLPDGALLFASGHPFEIFKTDCKGKQELFYKPPEDLGQESVWNLDIFENYLYIMLGSSMMLRVPIGSKETQRFTLPVTAYCFCTVDFNTLVYSNEKDTFPSKGLSQVNLDTGKRDKEWSVTDKFSFISAGNVDGKLYICATNGHVIKVFKEDHTLRAMCGYLVPAENKLGDPFGHVITQKGHILVADRGKNRISCFDLDGNFIQYILTERDGLHAPRSLAYRPPHLWIMEEGDQVTLKCFRFM